MYYTPSETSFQIFEFSAVSPHPIFDLCKQKLRTYCIRSWKACLLEVGQFDVWKGCERARTLFAEVNGFFLSLDSFAHSNREVIVWKYVGFFFSRDRFINSSPARERELSDFTVFDVGFDKIECFCAEITGRFFQLRLRIDYLGIFLYINDSMFSKFTNIIVLIHIILKFCVWQMRTRHKSRNMLDVHPLTMETDSGVVCHRVIWRVNPLSAAIVSPHWLTVSRRDRVGPPGYCFHFLGFRVSGPALDKLQRRFRQLTPTANIGTIVAFDALIDSSLQIVSEWTDI